ncbi:hypothetical protein CHS0354_025409 [Potamilus streckersoni]|uniref:Uncharacterized protein n=1 Tax=Potamilus streckersoni TaxID=2493646 RepID=A0AAE0SPH5_9BIVA|nr:hypothetical protein CHS0354_025409 [Potamilus streckersoni]
MARIRVTKSLKTGARKTEKKAVQSASQSKKKSGDRNLEISRKSDASQYDIRTDQSLKLKKFSSRQTRCWGPLNKLTRECVIKILDEGVKYLEERVSSQKYEDIQQQLAETRSRLIKKISCLHAPLKKFPDYRKLSVLKSSLIQQDDLLSEQIDELQGAIEEEEQEMYKQDEASRCNKKEEEINHCETYSSLLSRTVLDLPPLPSGC